MKISPLRIWILAKGVCRCQTNHISAGRGVPFHKLRPTADYGDLVNWLKNGCVAVFGRQDGSLVLIPGYQSVILLDFWCR